MEQLLQVEELLLVEQLLLVQPQLRSPPWELRSGIHRAAE